MNAFQIWVIVLLVLIMVGQVFNFMFMCAFANYAETVIKCLKQMIVDQGDMDFHLKGDNL